MAKKSIGFEELEKSVMRQKVWLNNDNKLLNYYGKCIKNLASYLSVFITEKGEIIAQKSKLDVSSQKFYPRADIVVCQLSEKVDRLNNLVENLSKDQLQEEGPKLEYQKFIPPRYTRSSDLNIPYSIGSDLHKYNNLYSLNGTSNFSLKNN